MSGRGAKVAVLGVITALSLSSCGGCSDNDSKVASGEAVVGQKASEHTLNNVTVSVPEGAVTRDAKLTVSSPVVLTADKTPFGDGVTPPSVQFDVSLDGGSLQPAAGKPLTLRIPLSGDFLPQGADPRGALVYTTTSNGLVLLDSEVVGDQLVVTTPHLSPKTVTYPTAKDIENLLANGALTEIKDDCPKQGSTPPLQELKITRDAPNELVQACLTTSKTDTFLTIRNRTPIMWGVKGSAGTEVLDSPDSFDDQAIKVLRGDLYDASVPQGILARSSYINVKLNTADLPATVEVRSHLRLVTAELTWKAVQLWLQVRSGKKSSQLMKDAKTYLVTVPGLHECLSQTAELEVGDVIGYVFTECGDVLGKLTIKFFGDEATGLLVPERWWNRIQAVGGGIKDGWHVVESGTMTTFNKFDNQKINIVVDVANPCLSADEFTGMVPSVLEALNVSSLEPDRVTVQNIQCAEGWALVEGVETFAGDYGPLISGPILLKWSGSNWEAMGIYASPFDSGINGGMVHESQAGCSAAPASFKNAVRC